MSNEKIYGDGAFRRQGVMGSIIENTYSGALSFMRRSYTRNLEGVDVVVSGVPLDLATTFRSGARLGPAAIRAASVQLAELNLFPWGFDPFDDLAVIDYGDCWFDAHRPWTIRESIKQHALDIITNSRAKMLTFGGDHYITYPLLQAHAEKYGKPLSLLHFDAHCDTWPDDEEDSLNHGTMFYKAVKNGLIDPKTSAQVGIRTWNSVGDNPVYLTFDIDCLDPAFAPGTGTPVPGGLSSHTALGIVRQLGDLNIVGMDVVEVAPAYDSAEITAIAAAHVAADMLCLMRNKKVAGKL